MKIIAITQARINSSRLHGKILKKIGNKTLLQIHLERLQQTTKVDCCIVAVANEPDSEAIIEICHQLKIEYSIGSTHDVLDRFYQALKPHQPDYVVRVTSDCPLIDPDLIDNMIDHIQHNDLDYLSNAIEPTYPDGFDVEIVKFSALEQAWREDHDPINREHVTPYISENSNCYGKLRYSAANFSHDQDFSDLRVTVDQVEDFITVKHLIEELGDNRTWLEYTHYLISHPEIAKINSHIVRNEGYQKNRL